MHADYLLQLQQDLSSEEMPPEWMWPLPWEMEQWIDRVVRERKAKYGGNDSDFDSADYTENEFATEWKKAAL
jgi:putative NADPH-quinone reductase